MISAGTPNTFLMVSPEAQLYLSGYGESCVPFKCAKLDLLIDEANICMSYSSETQQRDTAGASLVRGHCWLGLPLASSLSPFSDTAALPPPVQGKKSPHASLML